MNTLILYWKQRKEDGGMDCGFRAENDGLTRKEAEFGEFLMIGLRKLIRATAKKTTGKCGTDAVPLTITYREKNDNNHN